MISKVDVDGNEEWYKRLGGSDYDDAQNFGYESPNGDLNIMCLTSSRDGDIKKFDGGIDTWLLKLGRCGESDDNENDNAVSVLSDKAVVSAKNNDIHLSNYPNPFSGSTTISFSLPLPIAIGEQKVSIQIFDITGKLVKTLADAQMQAGAHQFTWNATNKNGSAVAKGMYLVKMQAGNYVETKKISVIK